MLIGGDFVRSQYYSKGEILHLLAALYPENRLALEISLATGLRINDVLALKPSKIIKGRFSVREEKTGKTKFVRLPVDLQKRAIECAGQHYVFEGRLNGKKHRTRQAVFKDLKRVARLFNLKANVTPHSMRKIYAVEEFKKFGSLVKVQKLLNHDNEAVTLLYALSDQLDKRKNFKNLNS